MATTLSITIPTFERTEFLEAAIESVINQTVVADEILVVDNGSSHSRIADIVARYSGVRYYRHPENLGMFGNWNSCADLSTQEYFMILGDDDILDRNFVYEIKKNIESKERPDIIFTDYQPFSALGTSGLWKSPMFFGNLTGAGIRKLSARHGLFFPIISCAIRKAVFKPFYSEIHGSNDWLWSISLPDDTKVHGISKKLVGYRKHGNGDSETGMWINMFTHMCIYWDLHQRLHKESPALSFIAGLRASKCAALIGHNKEALGLTEKFQSTRNIYEKLSREFECSIFWTRLTRLMIIGLEVRKAIRRPR